MPAAVAASLTDVVLAERQPDSEPTWEKPSVMVLVPPPPAALLFFLPHPSRNAEVTTAPAAPARSDRLLIILPPWSGADCLRSRGTGVLLQAGGEPVVRRVGADLVTELAWACVCV